MAFSPLIPIAGAALGSLAGKALERLSSGPSFQDVLQGIGSGEATSEAAAPPANTQAPSREELSTDLQAFLRKLTQRLRAAGVDGTVPIELKGDGRGGVITENPHPDRVAIERILANDPELAGEFQHLAAGFEASRQARGPFDPLGGNFRLRLNEQRVEVAFE